MTNIKSPYVKYPKEYIKCDWCKEEKESEKMIPTKVNGTERVCKKCWKGRSSVSKKELDYMRTVVPSGKFNTSIK